MQGQLITLIRIDLLLEIFGGIIALMISHYANTAFRLTGQKKLSDLSTGFMVLSAGMFSRVIGTLYFFTLYPGIGELTPEATSIAEIVIVAYGVLKIMAYAIFVYATHARRKQQAPQMVMLMALPFLISPSLEMIAITVLLIVVIQTLVNYASVRNRYAFFVLLGFLFLLISHVFGIYTQDPVKAIPAYLTSQIFQFLGLISFLVMLRQAGKNE
ncbi:MAG: hypothetical protein ACTSUO_05055 [Candidatus Thorarchaeota archaeon]